MHNDKLQNLTEEALELLVLTKDYFGLNAVNLAKRSHLQHWKRQTI